MTRMSSQLLISILCFLAGFGTAVIVDQIRERRRAAKAHLHPDAKKPGESAGVLVRDNKNGEPVVDRVLLKPSPVPGWLAVILIIIGVGTVASTIVQNQRDSETRRQVRVAQCQSFAQLKFRGDETRASYNVLGRAIRELTDPTVKREDTIKVLKSLADYYEAAGQDPGGLPPLSQKAIDDCKDGVFNDGYPNKDKGPPVEQAPPASPVPQSNFHG